MLTTPEAQCSPGVLSSTSLSSQPSSVSIPPSHTWLQAQQAGVGEGGGDRRQGWEIKSRVQVGAGEEGGVCFIARVCLHSPGDAEQWEREGSEMRNAEH